MIKETKESTYLRVFLSHVSCPNTDKTMKKMHCLDCNLSNRTKYIHLDTHEKKQRVDSVIKIPDFERDRISLKHSFILH